MLASAMAYFVLVRALIAAQPDGSRLADAVQRDVKGKISPAMFGLAIPLAFFMPLLSVGIYVVVIALWIVPDRRIERTLPR